MLRWNAQHGSLSRPSATVFHPATVSGVLFGGMSSCGSAMNSPGRSGPPSGCSSWRHWSPPADEQFAREDLQSLTLKRPHHRSPAGFPAVVSWRLWLALHMTVARGPSWGPPPNDPNNSEPGSYSRPALIRLGSPVSSGRSGSIGTGVSYGHALTFACTLRRRLPRGRAKHGGQG